MSTAISPRRSEWLVPAGLVLLSLVPAFFGSLRLAEIAGGVETTSANARFLSAPVPVVLHILAAIPYSIVGAFQFAPGLRRRHAAWHRAAGRILAGLGLTVAVTGLWMTLTYPWPEGDGVILYVTRLIVGLAMTISIVLALLAVRHRNFTAHGEWMIRGYAIALGAGTQVLTHLPWLILVGTPGELPRAVMMAGAWVINSAVAEWVIRQGRTRRIAVPPATGGRSRALMVPASG